jgi:hypothetical protein
VRKVDVDQSWRLWRPGGGQATRSREVRPAVERVSPVSDEPAVERIGMLEYKYPITLVQLKEGTYALQVTALCERDLQVGRGHPGGGFRPRRAGEQGCSLPPPAPPASLSLCSAFKTASAAKSAACEAEPAKSTAAPSRVNSDFDNPYL